jgi:AcrR family transcriptional regulator
MAKVTASRPYHHGDLRQSLIEAACKHLLESGADTLSLRALAREVGVSQTAPYRHFDSKSALFRAIALHGFELLFSETSAVAKQYEDDLEQSIVEIGMAYVGFARRHPEKYQLFFDSSLVDFNESDALVEAGSAAFGVLTMVIQKGIESGVFVDRPVNEVAGALWSSVHGAASLVLSKSSHMKPANRLSPAVQVMHQLSEDPRPTVELFLNAIRKPC